MNESSPAAIGFAASLDDLSETRRETLLWSWAHELDWYGVDDLVREAAADPYSCCLCFWTQRCSFHQDYVWSISDQMDTAVLGDDGRYHLRDDTNGRLWCVPKTRPETGARRGYRHRWYPPGSTFFLTDTSAPPETIPLSQRCPDVRGWPPHHNTGTKLGRIRAALIDELGAACHACRGDYGVFVDHDHCTGIVRGLLCRRCNNCIDRCLHRSGRDCLWSDYLDSPPAAPMALVYPKKGTTRVHREKVAYLGFDPEVGR